MQPCSRCGAEVADVTGFCLNCGPLVDMADFKDAMQFMRDLAIRRHGDVVEDEGAGGARGRADRRGACLD